MISDTPGRGGEGGVKKGQIFADVLYGWPLKVKRKNSNSFGIDETDLSTGNEGHCT